MGKSSPSTPAIPDPTTTANAQSGANVDTAAATAALNNTNQVTPYGSTTYDTTGSYTTPNGEVVPRYTQTTALTPLAQQLLTGQQTAAASLIDPAQQLARQAGVSATTPIDFNTPQSGILNSTPEQLSDRAADATYAKQKSFLDPQWNQQSQQLQDQLSRQGIPVGSEAYNNAMEQFNNSKTQAYDAASQGAIANGTGAASNLFNMALAGNQNNVSQQQLAESQPLSLLSQVLGATPASPSQPISTAPQVNIAPTDVIGATNSSTNAAMNQYQAQLSANNAQTGGTAALLGTAATAAALFF